ncbi:MAG TPA: GNAT family N-acetyltransferase [Candidatus Limnocylindrales bacterium]|nr:GNAT family N-acetyltransferase [Candidatus Limnocylindrales bacterium]
MRHRVLLAGMPDTLRRSARRDGPGKREDRAAMSSQDEIRITTAFGAEGSDSFVSVSPDNAAYTKFLLNLKATGKLAGEAEYFVALDNEEDRVGRMAAALGPHPNVGLVGLLALTEKRSDKAWVHSVIDALLSSCESWLLSLGVNKVYGPVDFSTFFEYRLRDRTEEQGEEQGWGPDFSWEPTQPQSYLLAFEAAGYAPVERYHSEFYATTTTFPPQIVVKMMEPAWRAAIDRGLEFIAFDEVRPVEKLIPIIEAISLEAFKENFLYSPVPGEVFEALYSPAVQKVDLSLSLLVRAPDGQEVGFLYAFEDCGYCVIKSIAVRPDWRKLHLSSALVQRCLARAAQRGLTRFASALVREGNASEFLESRHHRHPVRVWKHHYTLVGKTLKGAGR